MSEKRESGKPVPPEAGRSGEEDRPLPSAAEAAAARAARMAEETAEAAAGVGPEPSASPEPSGREGDLLEQLQRAAAELANYRTRAERESRRREEEARRGAILGFLGALDEFRRTLARAGEHPDPDSFREALRLVDAEFEKVLAGEGVERIKTKGELFDPRYHEAVERRETAEAPEAAILEELRPGFLHKGALLRPAQVVVAVRPAERRPE